MKRRAYIARYPLDETGNNLKEEILAEDTYWSPKLSNIWDKLVEEREPNWKTAPMLQAWYYDENQTDLVATTNQPFKLD